MLEGGEYLKSVFEYSVFRYSSTVNDQITGYLSTVNDRRKILSSIWCGYSNRGGYLEGVLVEYCLVQVTRTLIVNHSTLFVHCIRPENNTIQLQCQLYHYQHLSKKIKEKNRYFHFNLTSEKSKIVG